MAGDGDPRFRADGDDPDRRLRVVLIEDHAMLREQLVMLLCGAGIDVIAMSPSLAEGHRAVLDLHPDVVVLDSQLPDGPGVDLCRELTRELPGLHVLIHAGTVSGEQVSEAFAAGATAVIPKSIRGDALLGALQVYRARASVRARPGRGGARSNGRGNGRANGRGEVRGEVRGGGHRPANPR